MFLTLTDADGTQQFCWPFTSRRLVPNHESNRGVYSWKGKPQNVSFSQLGNSSLCHAFTQPMDSPEQRWVNTISDWNWQVKQMFKRIAKKELTSGFSALKPTCSSSFPFNHNELSLANTVQYWPCFASFHHSSSFTFVKQPPRIPCHWAMFIIPDA